MYGSISRRLTLLYSASSLVMLALAMAFLYWSLVEDVEQGIVLGRAGVRVHHAMETTVLGEMPSGAGAAGTQRVRWEQGRVQLRQKWLRNLLNKAWKLKSLMLLDLALDLAMPPFTTLVLLTATAWLAAGAVTLLGGGELAWMMWTAAALLLCFYVAHGVHLSPRGHRAWLDLGAAPLFVGWKVALALQRRAVAPATWVRTQRVGEKP